MYIDISKYNLEKFRQKQVNDAIFKNLVNSIDEISNIPNDLKQKISNDFTFPSIEPVTEVNQEQIVKNTFKAKDGKIFEGVLIKHKKNRQTVCVSSQIGCPVGCKFCATGSFGFERNLTSQEIVDQVLHFARILKASNLNITNIVYMGMGEPFLNTANLEKSIEILTNPEEFNIASRRITVSTIWTGEDILKFVKKYPQINMAISLHSAIQSKRDEIIPVSQKVSIQDIQKDIKAYFLLTNRRLTIEYLMLKDINDGSEDLEALIDFLEPFDRKLVHINLLPYNQTNKDYSPSDRQSIMKFKENLEKNNINTTTRKSMGQDIASACGMLKNTTSPLQ